MKVQEEEVITMNIQDVEDHPMKITEEEEDSMNQ